MYKAVLTTNKEFKANEAEKVPLSVQQNYNEVEELTWELERLLMKHAHDVNEAGIRHKVEILQRWMESYRAGHATTRRVLETGMNLLDDLRDRMKLASDEMQRLEGEGGNPAGKEQAERIEELLKAVRHIGIVRSHIERRFSLAKEEHEEQEEQQEDA